MENRNMNYPPIPPIPKPSLPTEKIPFDEKAWLDRYKYIIICLFIFIIIVIVQVKKYSNSGIKEIQVSDNKISMIMDKSTINADLDSKKTMSFLVNNSYLSRNLGTLFVIPMDKVRYLEQKYGSFTNCLSSGAEEGKNSIINIGFILNNQKVREAMSKIAELSERGGNIIITAEVSELKNLKGIPEEKIKSGISINLIKPDIYYLVDDIIIINEKYR